MRRGLASRCEEKLLAKPLRPLALPKGRPNPKDPRRQGSGRCVTKRQTRVLSLAGGWTLAPPPRMTAGPVPGDIGATVKGRAELGRSWKCLPRR